MTRTETVTLYQTSKSLWAKARHNKGKMDLMDLQIPRTFPYANEGWVAQLQAMFKAAEKASKAFAEAVKGMAVEDVVSIIAEGEAR